MQKILYIPIDTTVNSPYECEDLVKRGDILTLQIKIFKNMALADLTGQTVDLILKKSDNTYIQKTITSISNGTITATLDIQATVSAGLVSGEVQLSDSNGQSSTNTFTFMVDNSIADGVIEVSRNDINVLNDLRDLIAVGEATITQYENHILAIANSIEAVEALEDIKSYIDTNLPALISNNSQAVTNNNNLQNSITDGTNLLNSLENFENQHADISDISNKLNVINSTLPEKANQSDLNISNEKISNNASDIISLKNSVDANKKSITENTSSIAIQSYQVASLATGSPKAVSLAANMTDTTKNYIYVGTESGYITNNWYYYNGSAWVSGGVYGNGLVKYSTTIGKISKDIYNDFNGYKITSNTNASKSIRAVFTFDTNGISLSNNVINFIYNIFSQSSNIINSFNMYSMNNNSDTIFGGQEDYSESDLGFIVDDMNYYSANRGNFNTSYRYIHLCISLKTSDTSNIESYMNNIICSVGGIVIPLIDYYFYTSDADNGFIETINQIQDKQLATIEKTHDIVNTHIENESILNRKTANAYVINSKPSSGNIIQCEFIIDMIDYLNIVSSDSEIVFSFDFLNNDDNIINFKSQFFINNDSNYQTFGDDSVIPESIGVSNVLNKVTNYSRIVQTVNANYRYIHCYINANVRDASKFTEFVVGNINVSLGGNNCIMISEPKLYNNQDPSSIIKKYTDDGIVTFSMIKSKWYGKTLNVLGDSLTYGYNTTKTYHEYLEERLGLAKVNNYGVSGTTIAVRSGRTDSFVERYSSMNTVADLILIMGGINDALNQIPIGNKGDTDNTTVYGALSNMFSGLTEMYPYAKIGIILETPSAGVMDRQELVTQAVKEMAEYYCLPYIDLYHQWGINVRSSAIRGIYVQDSTHPNALGHKRIADRLETFLESL